MNPHCECNGGFATKKLRLCSQTCSLMTIFVVHSRIPPHDHEVQWRRSGSDFPNPLDVCRLSIGIRTTDQCFPSSNDTYSRSPAVQILPALSRKMVLNSSFAFGAGNDLLFTAFRIESDESQSRCSQQITVAIRDCVEDLAGAGPLAVVSG